MSHYVEAPPPRPSPASAGEGGDAPSPSRGGLRPSFPKNLSPSNQEGAGNAGCRLAPAVSCANSASVCAHEHTGTAGAARHSLRSGFTAYTALSLETNSFCLHRRRIEDVGKPGRVRNISAGLTPATGARTTRLRRTHPHHSSKGTSASTASHPALVTIAKRPSYRDGTKSIYC